MECQCFREWYETTDDANYDNNNVIIMLNHKSCTSYDLTSKVTIPRVIGQNGTGQNGTDKLVWTKW